ncbi:MAG: hypothetical protein NTX50_25620 [Candidatus Sumerlaeota bacterium]|nr:hypothetical protein [Candidatus Sumerlaeota bacterium]
MTHHPGASITQPRILCLPRAASFSISHFSFLILHCLIASQGRAVTPATWNFTLESQNNSDASYDPASPILDNDCVIYHSDFHVTKAEVLVGVKPFQFWLDITAMLPDLSSSGTQYSALPIIFLDRDLSYSGSGYTISLHAKVWVDADGLAHATLTSVSLSGISGVRITGNATVTAMRTLTTAVSGGHGTLAPPGGPQPKNSVVPLLASPESGYHVLAWSGADDDTSSATTNQATMNVDRAVTVTFAPDYYITSAILADYLLGRGTLLPGQIPLANPNGDAALDIADLIALIRSGK